MDWHRARPGNKARALRSEDSLARKWRPARRNASVPRSEGFAGAKKKSILDWARLTGRALDCGCRAGTDKKESGE
jgi:hypothetical protein